VHQSGEKNLNFGQANNLSIGEDERLWNFSEPISAS
jgi:hypothetical protein